MMRYLINKTVLLDHQGKTIKYLVGGERVDQIEWEHGVALIQTSEGLEGFVVGMYLDDYVPVFEEPLLRLPEDEEIAQAHERRDPSQFIRLDRVGVPSVHKNLCGEFCCAALAGRDVIPVLQEWKEKYPRAWSILSRNKGTNNLDLINLLLLLGYNAQTVEMGYGNYPSPTALKDRLPAIVGCGINTRGTIIPAGATRHWALAMEVKKMGVNAWVRCYNPYWNREEDVLYSDLLDNGNRLTVITTVV